MSGAIERTNMMYGELNIKERRVIYVHGSVDPWHALGITQTKTEYTVAIYINGIYDHYVYKKRSGFLWTLYKIKRLWMWGGSFLYCHFTGTAHCANMYPPASTDPPQLQKARMTIRAFLFEWLTQNDYIVSDDNIQFF